ncbi:MAG: 30S ribosomal protein S17e [archaeon]
MGRIKSTLIKRSGKKLLKINEGAFTSDFNKNKKIVSEKAEISSKKLRNTIAGYITRKVKKSQPKK